MVSSTARGHSALRRATEVAVIREQQFYSIETASHTEANTLKRTDWINSVQRVKYDC